MTPVLIFVAVFALFVAVLVMRVKQAGPRQLSEAELARATLIMSSTAEGPYPSWGHLGSKTRADGLNLRFDHDDDPQAEAHYVLNERGLANTLSHRVTVRLTESFETHHVHTRGYVFRVRVRGTGPVVGKEIKIMMHVASDGTPLYGAVENDDDTDAAVGGWIEFESVEVLQAPDRGR